MDPLTADDRPLPAVDLYLRFDQPTSVLAAACGRTLGK